MGAARQVLCHLDGVDGLGAHLALFGAQPLTLVAEYASRGKRRCGVSPGPVGTPSLIQECPHALHSPAAVAGEARGALGQAAALVDAEGGGAAGHRAQAGTALCRDTAPGLMLVGAWRAGPVTGTLEVEVTTGQAGPGVLWSAAAPQAFGVAALPPSCAGQPMGTGTHCGQSAELGLPPTPPSRCQPLPWDNTEGWHPDSSSADDSGCWLAFPQMGLLRTRIMAPLCGFPLPTAPGGGSELRMEQ